PPRRAGDRRDRRGRRTALRRRLPGRGRRARELAGRGGAPRNARDDRGAGCRRRGQADGDDPHRPGARGGPLPRQPPVLEGAGTSGVVLRRGSGWGNPDPITVRPPRAIEESDALFFVPKTGVALTAPRRALVDRPRTRPHREVELPAPPRPWRDAPDYKEAVA